MLLNSLQLGTHVEPLGCLLYKGPRFQVSDLESLQLSHMILVSLKSHSGGIKSQGQGSVGPIQDLKMGQVKMVGGVPGLEQGQGKEAPPSQHQSPRTI